MNPLIANQKAVILLKRLNAVPFEKKTSETVAFLVGCDLKREKMDENVSLRIDYDDCSGGRIAINEKIDDERLNYFVGFAIAIIVDQPDFTKFTIIKRFGDEVNQPIEIDLIARDIASCLAASSKR